VGTLLWYNSGGPNNSVNDILPRDRIYDRATRRAEFQTISQAGVSGIKVDFFHADGQQMMQFYIDIMRDAAEFHLLTNFHGSTIQRGWQRQARAPSSRLSPARGTTPATWKEPPGNTSCSHAAKASAGISEASAATPPRASSS
jgi:hypothetical protein